ncbi:MAG: FCD domain-containing protein [Vulcanimicrobiaceae bacterium]
MGPKDIAAMRRANRLFASALHAGDPFAAMEADDALHGVLVEASQNREIGRALAVLMPKIRRLEYAQFGRLARRESVREHERIIAACALGERTRAKAIDLRHSFPTVQFCFD